MRISQNVLENFLLLGLLLLLADADAAELELVASNAPLAEQVGVGHLLIVTKTNASETA